jgi:hypothetical protein
MMQRLAMAALRAATVSCIAPTAALAQGRSTGVPRDA